MIPKRFQLPTIIAITCLLAACDLRNGNDTPPAFVQGEGQLAWQAMRPCVDCDGVESRLTLQWSDGDWRYQMVDTYFVDEAAQAFPIEGVWRHRDGMILLDDEDGTWQTYRLLRDGRLQVHAGRGDDGDVLMPLGVIDDGP